MRPNRSASPDPALRKMVLIGHSQGGLLTRLMVTDSGQPFWDNGAPTAGAPEDDAEARALLKSTMFFEPLPFVTRVVFICTPTRAATASPRSS